MVGVILCGGQSSRMGRDKGLIASQSVTWAALAAEKMDTLHIPVVLSVNEGQLFEYAAFFPANKLVQDNKKAQAKGPLAGILSVHIEYPAEDLFVLACDMPLMETGMLQYLNLVFANQAIASCAFTNEGQYEPLCAIYSAKGLAQVWQLLQTQQLVKHSMKYVLDILHAVSIPLGDDQKKYFRNINTMDELNDL